MPTLSGSSQTRMITRHVSSCRLEFDILDSTLVVQRVLVADSILLSRRLEELILAPYVASFEHIEHATRTILIMDQGIAKAARTLLQPINKSSPLSPTVCMLSGGHGRSGISSCRITTEVVRINRLSRDGGGKWSRNFMMLNGQLGRSAPPTLRPRDIFERGNNLGMEA